MEGQPTIFQDFFALSQTLRSRRIANIGWVNVTTENADFKKLLMNLSECLPFIRPAIKSRPLSLKLDIPISNFNNLLWRVPSFNNLSEPIPKASQPSKPTAVSKKSTPFSTTLHNITIRAILWLHKVAGVYGASPIAVSFGQINHRSIQFYGIFDSGHLCDSVLSPKFR